MVKKIRKPWDWELIEKKSSVAQNITIIIAAICAGIWAINQLFIEGRNISGSSITLSAKQLYSTEKPYLVSVDVAIKGADRRGYHYDFRESRLSVAKAQFQTGPEIELEAIMHTSPTIVHITDDGQIGGATSQDSHISSFRNTTFSFLVPVPGPGIYLLTFEMPSSGVLDATTGKNNIDVGDDPNVIGIFVGESEAIYFNVSDKNANSTNQSI